MISAPRITRMDSQMIRPILLVCHNTPIKLLRKKIEAAIRLPATVRLSIALSTYPAHPRKK
jgi:Na+-translocating ferredoxin:NAD+ oxidoreductase RnfE subunit